jgi:hypothetical protein
MRPDAVLEARCETKKGNKMRNSGKTKEKFLNAAILLLLFFAIGTPVL